MGHKKNPFVFAIAMMPLIFMVVAWVQIHVDIWRCRSFEYEIHAVSVKQEALPDMFGVRQISSVTPDARIDVGVHYSHGICARFQHSSYPCHDSCLVNMVYTTTNTYDIVALYLAKRGLDRAIIGYRYYDANSKQYVNAYTEESYLWWAKPNPNFIECFFSLDFLYHIL